MEMKLECRNGAPSLHGQVHVHETTGGGRIINTTTLDDEKSWWVVVNSSEIIQISTALAQSLDRDEKLQLIRELAKQISEEVNCDEDHT